MTAKPMGFQPLGFVNDQLPDSDWYGTSFCARAAQTKVNNAHTQTQTPHERFAIAMAIPPKTRETYQKPARLATPARAHRCVATVSIFTQNCWILNAQSPRAQDRSATRRITRMIATTAPPPP